jgi:chorismate mutase/prephenate dehydrogenase
VARPYNTVVQLDELRGELADIDRQLLELAARRRRLAEAVGLAKETGGLPIRDFHQEKEVLERARLVAESLELSSEVAEDLMRLLIREALSAQERQRVVAHAEGSGQRALVIGGAGRMGSWFARFLDSQGFAVEVADPAGGPAGFSSRGDWRDSPLDHDVIVVATPLATAARVLTELAERRPTGLVFDIGSLKSPVRAGLDALQRAGVRVASVHPMFGPDTDMLSGRHVIFVDAGSPEAVDQAEALFSSTMAERVRMSLDEHDRVVAFVLGLSHALNIAFFSALAESGEDVPKLSALSSTTFEQQLAVAERVAGDNPVMYFEIQTLNLFGGEALEALERAVAKLREVVAGGDEAAFVAMMERGRDYLSGRRTG